MQRPDLLIGITGASGSIYGVRLLEAVASLVAEVHVVVSARGAEVMNHELGLAFDAAHPSCRALLGRQVENVRLFRPEDMTAPCASGSGAARAMVIVPCSMSTVARIAAGLADDLIGRAADVALKERRRLIVVPRETPLNLVHLRNLTAVTEAGATVLPASPGFYHRPQSLDELVEFIVGRVLDHLDLPFPQKRWGVSGD